MDFSKLNTRADADRGAWLHFAHPQLGHPMFTGPGADEHGRLADANKPHQKVEAMIKGIESEVVRTRMRNMQGRKGSEAEDAKFAASLVTDLRGVQDGARDVTASEEDILWLFGRSASFQGQVMAFALEPSNFFGAATS